MTDEKKPVEETTVAEEKKAVEVPAKFKSLVEEIEKMSVMDLAELVKILEDKFGVSAAAPMMAMAMGPAAGAEAAVEEKSDGAPKVIKQAVKKEEAEVIKTKIVEAGGQVNLK